MEPENTSKDQIVSPTPTDFVGDTAIRDRSKMPSAYKDISTVPAGVSAGSIALPESAAPKPQKTTDWIGGAITFVVGLALGVAMMFPRWNNLDSAWVEIILTAMAIACIVVACISYRRKPSLNPLHVLGLSVAMIMLVTYIGNRVISYIGPTIQL